MQQEKQLILDKMLARVTGARATALLGSALFRICGLSREPASTQLAGVKSALVVRVDEIGDVVMTSAFLRELRRNLPNSWITLVVKSSVSNLVERCPYVNEVLTFDWTARGCWCHLTRHIRVLRLVSQRLWKRRFDVAISPRHGIDYYSATKIMFLSGAPLRVGWSEDVVTPEGLPRNNFDQLLSHTVLERKLKHQVELNLDVIRFLGGVVRDESLELWLSKEDEAFANDVFRRAGTSAIQPIVALGIGAGAGRKEWPVERFVQLGKWLQSSYGARLLLVGGVKESGLAKDAVAALGRTVVDVVGKASLRETAACLKSCRLFVGNDSGPMHLAAAVKVPVVEISWHPKNSPHTSPDGPFMFGPWGVANRIVRPNDPLSPCTDECQAQEAHCILGVKVEDVQAAVAELFPSCGVSESIR